jgi:hypothetical protein
MTRIFISYRRQDTRQIAGRIFDRLEAHFGRDHVFMDIDSIPFGVDFHKYLDQQVARADAVLALIGQGWADARDEAGNRRLDDPDDFVRIEIEAALKRGIPLGAVLIDGAPMPRPEQLPEDMRALCRRNAAPVDSGRDFHVHMNRLIADLERHLSGAVVEPVADAVPSPDGQRTTAQAEAEANDPLDRAERDWARLDIPAIDEPLDKQELKKLINRINRIDQLMEGMSLILFSIAVAVFFGEFIYAFQIKDTLIGKNIAILESCSKLELQLGTDMQNKCDNIDIINGYFIGSMVSFLFITIYLSTRSIGLLAIRKIRLFITKNRI